MARDASAANRVATTESLRAEAINHFRNKIGTKRTSQDVGAFVRFRGAADKHARVASTALDVNDPHVEILCAASARVKVRIFYQPLTAPTGLGLLVAFRGGSFPGRAARGSVAPRKMACRPPAGKQALAVQGHQLAHKGGAAWWLPLSNREREWTPRRATLLCSPPCRCSAQASPGVGVTLFWDRSFLRSVQLPFSA
jgi:hypothetical protein